MSDINKFKKARGNVIFKDDILLSVINLATKEIAGVSSLIDNFGDVLSGWFKSNYRDGVKITTGKKSTVVDVYINVFSGYNVTDLACKVQENIKNSIASMVDMNIDKVNVHVLGVDFNKHEEF